jgi:Bacteriophage HK97-gp10, putative tail-component
MSITNGYGLRIVYDKMPEIMRRLDDTIDDGVERGALIAKGNIQDITPVASGRHKNSIVARKTGKMRAQVESDPDLEYPLYLEFGTSRMAARPHFTPGGDGSKSQIQELLERAMMDLAR